MATNVFPVDAVAGAPEYTGRETRQVLSALVGGATVARPLGGRSGVCAGPTSVVTASGGNWSVGLHNGVLDLQTAVESGVYLYANDVATTPSAITAAHATYARKDIVYVKLDDPAESDGSSVPAVTFLYQAGTASASPAAPATPARSMVLGEINVPNVAGGGASSATVSQVWPYAAALGGVIPVRTSAERDLITFGTAANVATVFRLDLGVTQSNYGAGWYTGSIGPWVTYTATLGAGWAVGTTGGNYALTRWRYEGDNIFLEYRFVQGTNGTATFTSGATFTLPVTADATEALRTGVGVIGRAASSYHAAPRVEVGGTICRITLGTAPHADVTAATPFGAWAALDVTRGHIIYKPA